MKAKCLLQLYMFIFKYMNIRLFTRKKTGGDKISFEYAMEDLFRNFEDVRDALYRHFEENMANGMLFRVDCDAEDLWDLYMDSLPEAINPIFRERKAHDCGTCHSFFRHMANVVAVDEDTYELTTLFDCMPSKDYESVFKALDEFIKSHEIVDIFKHYSQKAGHEFDSELLEDGTIIRHNHFHLDIPRKHIGYRSDVAEARVSREVLESTTNEISLDSVDTVLELIDTNSLYRGNEWKDILEKFRTHLIEMEKVDEKDLNAFYWIQSIKLGPLISRLKNKSIGTLLVEISLEVPLDEAVKNYEEIVAPTNYKRPKAIFTKAMLKRAEEKIDELGFKDSLPRRFAVMEDLSVKDVLFANRDVTPQLQESENLFDRLRDFTTTKIKNFDKVQDIPISEFIENVLPHAQEVELYLNYDLANNFVSLIAPINKDAPSMFKWDNLFSWAYKNNIADSLMKQRVKAMGGDVDVDLRFSIQWNDHDEWDKNDLDAHCSEPTGFEIYYRQMRSKKTDGWLDVDIIDPKNGEAAVENIRYKDKSHMVPGNYKFRVHQYTYRGGDRGFKAEVEFDGRIYKFEYPFKLRQKEYVDVATVTLDEDGNFNIKSHLDTQSSNIKEWNLSYNTFVPVSLICYSPNYWGDNEVGNKHVFFMLKDCVNEDRLNPWFNEFLIEELMDHKRVMEALASIAKVEESPNQLSGVGFSLTKRNKVTLKVKTENIERVINVVI